MIPEYLADVVATGAEVSIIAEPREVIIDCRHGNGVDDRHMASIAKESDLTWLWLTECRVSNEGVRKLVANQRLEYLDLGLTSVDGSVLELVPMLRNLEGIGLEGVTRMGDGVHHLLHCPRLNTLYLSRTDITRSDLRRLLLETNVTWVEIEDTGIAAGDLLDLDDIDAEPYRSVVVRLGPSESIGLVMARREFG